MSRVNAYLIASNADGGRYSLLTELVEKLEKARAVIRDLNKDYEALKEEYEDYKSTRERNVQYIYACLVQKCEEYEELEKKFEEFKAQHTTNHTRPASL